MKICRFVLVLLAVMIVAGCGKHGIKTGQEVSAESLSQRERLERQKFEVVWVDPAVIASDFNMTLIRSDRLDSIQLPPGEIITSAAPAISFDIVGQPCLTTVKMLDARGKVLEPLLLKTLNPGHYKLTVHKPPPGANPNIPYNYSLEAIFCGQTKTERISPTWTGRE